MSLIIKDYKKRLCNANSITEVNELMKNFDYNNIYAGFKSKEVIELVNETVDLLKSYINNFHDSLASLNNKQEESYNKLIINYLKNNQEMIAELIEKSKGTPVFLKTISSLGYRITKICKEKNKEARIIAFKELAEPLINSLDNIIIQLEKRELAEKAINKNRKPKTQNVIIIEEEIRTSIDPYEHDRDWSSRPNA